MSWLWRITTIIAAYLGGVIGLFVAFAVLFGVASLLPFAPGYWTLTGVSPVIFAGAPSVGLFLIATAIVLSAVPTLLIVVLAEVLSWRSLAVYALPAAMLSGVIYWTFSPRTVDGLDPIGLIEAALFAVSGAFAGVIYWSIAGRRAGTWR